MVEHWRPGGISFRSLHGWQLWTEKNNFLRRRHYDSGDRSSECISYIWHVHWGSVRILFRILVRVKMSWPFYLSLHYFCHPFGRSSRKCMKCTPWHALSLPHTFGNSFLIGFGLTFAACAAPLLVTEIAFPTQRAQATSMYNTLWWAVFSKLCRSAQCAVAHVLLAPIRSKNRRLIL